MGNQRIIKKLSRRAAEHLPNVRWDFEDSEPYCESLDYLKKGTPVLWYRCSYEYQEYESLCAWTVLKRLFLNARDSAIACDKDWFWPQKPTPENVFFWAYWNETELGKVKESFYGY